MYDRPQGVDIMEDPDGCKAVDVINQCNKFVEVKACLISDSDFALTHARKQLTGEAGDVFLCHPLMVSWKSNSKESLSESPADTVASLIQRRKTIYDGSGKEKECQIKGY